MAGAHIEAMSQEQKFLRWGGLAGIAGGIVFVFVPVILFGFVPPAPADPAGLVARFPDVRTAIAAGNFVNFVSNALMLALILALYRALRGTSLAPALVGTFLFIIGLGVIFTETATQVAFDPISNLYHAPGATPQDQATLALLWQATQGMFNELDTAALLAFSAGVIVLGVAMFQSPTFGKAYGGVSVALGTMTLVSDFLFGITSFVTALLVIPVFIILPILWGRKVYRLSTTASAASGPSTAASSSGPWANVESDARGKNPMSRSCSLVPMMPPCRGRRPSRSSGSKWIRRTID